MHSLTDSLNLRLVVIEWAVLLIALQILALDERLYPLLNLLDVRFEAELLQTLRHELLVDERLPALHNADDGGIDLVLSVRVDLLCRPDPLLLRLHDLDLVHLDPPQPVLVLCIQLKLLSVAALHSLGPLQQNARRHQAQQSTLKLTTLDLRRLNTEPI